MAPSLTSGWLLLWAICTAQAINWVSPSTFHEELPTEVVTGTHIASEGPGQLLQTTDALAVSPETLFQLFRSVAQIILIHTRVENY